MKKDLKPISQLPEQIKIMYRTEFSNLTLHIHAIGITVAQAGDVHFEDDENYVKIYAHDTVITLFKKYQGHQIVIFKHF